MKLPRDAVTVARVALLVTAAIALVVAVAWPTASRRGHRDAGYVCPMHPEVVSADPGTCPICGMALTARRAEAASGEVVVLTMTPHPPTGHLAATDTVQRIAVSSHVHAAAFIDDLGRAIAIMDEQQIASLKENEEGTFVRAGAPPLAARLTPAPPERWDDGTSRVIFDLDARPAAGDGASEEPAPGTVGWIDLPERARPALVIPPHAIIDSARGPYVLVSSPDRRTYQRRFIRFGGTRGPYAVIIAGLSEGEQIAVAGASLLDAERRLRVGPRSDDDAPDSQGRAP